MARIRAIQFIVQPVLVVDDGESLVPLSVEPITIPAARWSEFVEHGLDAALAQLQEQVEAGRSHPEP